MFLTPAKNFRLAVTALVAASVVAVAAGSALADTNTGSGTQSTSCTVKTKTGTMSVPEGTKLTVTGIDAAGNAYSITYTCTGGQWVKGLVQPQPGLKVVAPASATPVGMLGA